MQRVSAPIVGYCDADLSAGPDAIMEVLASVDGFLNGDGVSWSSTFHVDIDNPSTVSERANSPTSCSANWPASRTTTLDVA